MNIKLLGSQSGEAGFTALIWLDVDRQRVFCVSDMDEDNDGPGGSLAEDPDWQPETSLRHEGKSIDSRKVAGVVVPAWLPRAVGPVVLGSQAFVTNLATGEHEAAVVYDLGPTRKSGEGSNLLCRRVGAKGGENRPVFLYEIMLGVPATVDGVTYELQPLRS